MAGPRAAAPLSGAGTGRFDGLAALVTGAASGIAERRPKHCGAPARPCWLSTGKSRWTSTKGRVVALVADVTDSASVQRAVDGAVASSGGIDVLVNNAGIGMVATTEDGTEEQWLHVLDANGPSSR
jgi:2-keto-3-deoxy-L-fuconate dehydrogenase